MDFLKKINDKNSYYLKTKAGAWILVYLSLFSVIFFIFLIFNLYKHINNENIVFLLLFIGACLCNLFVGSILQVIDDCTSKNTSSPFVLFLNNLHQIEKDYLKNKKITWFFLFIILSMLFNLLFQSDAFKINNINSIILNIFPKEITILLFLTGIGLSTFFTDLILLITKKISKLLIFKWR